MKVPLASSGLRDSDIETVLRVLKSGNLTMGKEVKNFERKMASYLGVKHFIMVNSGSSANLLMIEALMRPAVSKPRLNPGDSIMVPAIAWPTTIWPLIQLGLNPLFVDIDPSTLALDLKAAQELIDSSRIPVRGLFPIHPLGRALSPSELTTFAHKNELILINDVCESLGSWSEGKHAGTEGVAGSFSFYFSHHITTMEGGGISTDDDEFADDLRSMRSHGWSRDRSDVDTWTANKSANDSKFLFVSTGYNVRPMEIQAAIGSAQIDSLDSFIEKRRHIASRVSSSLNQDSLVVIGGETLKENPESNSWMLIPILVKGAEAPARKKLILEQLEKLGIETRPILTGNFLAQPAIQRITRHAIDPQYFAEATRITNQAFMVGAHHDLSDAQVDYLCESLSKVGEL
ncbi:MAG: aminotransferase class I/II-fold pyridoxal phosphate-dependent enzyme [Actinobacteria bacterium]|nr:aminotransferase class I/II-fold pyridoxal phosphate-dependent enzyme [Actinomycetota bacterium]